MLQSLAYAVARLLLEILIVRSRPKARLEAEVLALRHQLRILERQSGRPLRQPADRVVLSAISRVLPRPDWRSLLPRPETLLRWHRELVRRKWAAYRRRPQRHRPAARNELHELILKLARENERWGQVCRKQASVNLVRRPWSIRAVNLPTGPGERFGRLSPEGMMKSRNLVVAAQGLDVVGRGHSG